ncbi:hypothetical protein AYX13_02165 [Cryptococcus neoformans]|nr:hypothetical protein AYX13_02165 [Cryptococcus neoformans var. grubii]
MFFSLRSSLSKNILGQSPRLRIISLSVISSRIRKMSSQAATSSATVAVCQLRSTGDPVHNLKISEKVIRSAVAAGAKACFLPEASDFINPSKIESRKFSLPLPKHEYTIGLQTLAKELGIVISVGVHEGPEDESEERVYNTHVLIGKDGGILATYRKIHLFDVELSKPPAPDGTPRPPQHTGESERILAGQAVTPPVEVEGIGKIGLEICYDIRFSELSIILTRLGAEVLLFPSAFTVKTGRDHWGTLCRATAIQYQSYLIASAQYGAHNSKRTSWGETLAVDPWGRQLGRLRSVDDTPPPKEGEEGDKDVEKLYEDSGEFFLCEIDGTKVKETRGQIPLAIQKRSDVYGVVGKDA